MTRVTRSLDVISGGIVTGLGKKGASHINDVIMVNLNMYRGDSGGPLFNRDGHLIGMIAAKITSKERVTLVIPSNKIHELYYDYIK